MRGATWMDGVSSTPSSKTWTPFDRLPEFGTNVPILTAGRISPVIGLTPRRPFARADRLDQQRRLAGVELIRQEHGQLIAFAGRRSNAIEAQARIDREVLPQRASCPERTTRCS